MTDRLGPIAAIRLRSITIVPFSMTSADEPAGVATVITRAPTSASTPLGTSVFTVKPIGMPFASGSSAVRFPPLTVNRSCQTSREELGTHRPVNLGAVA